MSTILGPALCGLIYALTALAFAREGRAGWSLTYFAYSLANIGLIWASVAERKM
jgi:hypothetical protein